MGGGNDHCRPCTHYMYYQNGIDLHPYTQCFPPPSAFIHGGLWGSFRLLHKGRIDRHKHVCRYFR